jgi:hypothetical protein
MDLYDDVGRPADRLVLPAADDQQMQADIGRWLETAPSYGIQVVGPPLPG